MLKTRLSSKGQVIIPKSVRDHKGWRAGDELIVEERPEGLLLRRAKPFKRTTIEEVTGSLKPKYKGPPRTVEEMDEAVSKYVRKRWERYKA